MKSVSFVRFNGKEKSGIKKWAAKSAIKGAKVMKNDHFFWNTSLILSRIYELFCTSKVGQNMNVSTFRNWYHTV